MRAEMALPNQTVTIRTSIGMALAPLHGTDPVSLSQSADIALYRSKQAGRHGITLAGGTDSGSVGTLEEELRAAIAEDAPILYWQPYFCARSVHPTGYEALLRWTCASGEAVSPTDMVALAEKNGFIVELDRMVLRRACAEAAAWPQPLMASVNMSARSFSSVDLVSLVSTVLAETGLSPKRLTIELTESTLVAHTERARERINGLQKLGVRVAMDDFGTGYASLRYLSSFDFDVLKLDRTFVRELGSNPGQRQWQRQSWRSAKHWIRRFAPRALKRRSRCGSYKMPGVIRCKAICLVARKQPSRGQPRGSRQRWRSSAARANRHRAERFRGVNLPGRQWALAHRCPSRTAVRYGIRSRRGVRPRAAMVRRVNGILQTYRASMGQQWVVLRADEGLASPRTKC